MKSRRDAMASIDGKSFDVCVIGGGATGSGCALDSQLRGLSTVLLEAGDFGCATSSASTKMAHGGVRYLEEAIRGLDPKEYAVLKRALHERIHMLRNAPHLTRTKCFVTPCFNWVDVAYLKAGLTLYDWIAGRDGLAPSEFISREEVLRRMPKLAHEKLVGAVVYADGQFDDARYNLALVETFCQAGGEALNYARVTGFAKNASGRIVAANVSCELTGGQFEVRARAFVNATGARADTIRAMASATLRPRMRPSKGVHILLPIDVFSSENAMLIPKTDDGRVLFAIPWFGRLLVGTTDDEVNAGDELYVTQTEVEYLLRYLNRFLEHPVSREQVLSGTAGARPLVSSGEESTDTKRLARDHEVEVEPQSGLVSILGGKWTTYRAMAEDTIDAVQTRLGGEGSNCATLNHRLAGSENYSDSYLNSLVERFGVSAEVARHLAEKFGTRAERVTALAAADVSLAKPIVEGAPPILAEVVYSARCEMAMTIEDVLARRTGLQLWSWKDAVAAAPRAGTLLAAELEWTPEETDDAVREYVEKIRQLASRAGVSVS